FPDMGTIGFESDPSTKLLADYASQLQKEPTARGFIIAHGGIRLTFAEVSAQNAKNHLVNKLGVDAGRLVAKAADDNQIGGEAPLVELWIAPQGASPPKASIRTVDTRADDLTVLNGIGAPRMKVLNKAGFKTFADLATADPNRLIELFPTEKARVPNWIKESKKRAK